MPNSYFVIFELMVWGLFLLCWYDARRRGKAVVWKLIAGVLFGLLLEKATLHQLHAYRYGRFIVMFGDVPLVIGMSWGVIIYSVTLFSDATDLPLWLRPVLDGLLALNIDLAIDTIAIRLGMWNWGKPLTSGFFGVPYANFWAWFWVVFSFSMAVRLLEASRWPFRAWLSPAGGVLFGVLGVLATNQFIVFIVPAQWYKMTVFGTLGLALLLVLFWHPDLAVKPLSLPAGVVPLAFHAYFLAAGLISGAALQPPWILVVSATMFGLAAMLHWPWKPARGHAV